MPWWERQREAERPTMPPPMIRTGISISEDMVVGLLIRRIQKEDDFLSFLVKRSSYSSIHGYEVAVPLGRTASAGVAERNPRVFLTLQS